MFTTLRIQLALTSLLFASALFTLGRFDLSSQVVLLGICSVLVANGYFHVAIARQRF